MILRKLQSRAAEKARFAFRRARQLLRLLPAYIRLAWSYCIAPQPSETFAVDASIHGQQRRIKVDVFHPARTGRGGKSPAVVLLHGVDGAVRYSSSHYVVAGELARQGYVVYFVHYFDSVAYDDLLIFNEYGELHVPAVEEYCERDSHHWVSAVTEALRAIAARPEVDARQVALFGYSLGCFVSLSAAEESLRQKGLPKVVAVVGHWGAKFRRATFSVGFPPTRLFHGTKDPVVLLDWARQTLESLRAIGVDAALMEIPRKGHRATSRKAWRESLAFLKKQIVGESGPEQPFAGGLNEAVVG